jgi:acyl-CoA reductase-like NAD-dependent aldehyde dehydrogenase
MEEFRKMEIPAEVAQNEIACAIDRLVYYAGWCDKYTSVFGTVNPVATPHFNFSVPEPMGVIAAFAPEKSALAGLISLIAPIIAGGNTCIVIASFENPLCAITMGEVFQVSDLPAGVVNILTGQREELAPALSEHMDVNAVVLAEIDEAFKTSMQQKASGNVKRVIAYEDNEWLSDKIQSPYRIMDLQEVKTTWHPIETYGGSSSAY